MRTFNSILSRIGCIMGFVIIVSQTSCDKSEDPVDDRKLLIDKIVGKTWMIHSVAGPDGDETLNYASNKITFIQVGGQFKVNYSAANGQVIWPSAGVLEFSESSSPGSFTRSDGIIGTLELPTDNELIVTLEWTKTTVGKGRMHSIEGKHTFTYIGQ